VGDVGTKLIFENDRVKVWELTLQPGEALGPHTHAHDYLILPIEGSTMEVTHHARGTVDVGEFLGGAVIYREKGDSHTAKNIGPARYHQLLVELKG
jgi:hypothetical protein